MTNSNYILDTQQLPRPHLLPNFIKVNMTLNEFLMKWINLIDCQPVGQRLDTDREDNSKKEGIINSILQNINFGEITICETPNNLYGYKYESIDGGHRKRYTRDYVNGNSFTRFRVNNKYYSELSEEERKRVENYPITLVIYDELDVFTKGYIFRNLNKTTDVNDQETRNSFGDIDVANLIRESVRIIQGVGNLNHELFTLTQGGKYRYLQFDNSRLKTEEMIARLVHRISLNNMKATPTTKPVYLGESSQDQLTDMYHRNDEIDIVKTKKELKEILDFLLVMANEHLRLYNRMLSQRDFKMLSFVWFYMKDSFKVWSIPSTELFMKAYKKAFNKLTDPNGRYGKILNKQDFDDKGRTVAEAFKGYLGAPQNKKKVIQLVVWLMGEFKIEEFIIIKDAKRKYSYAEKLRKLIEQNYKCYITGQKITMRDCEAAHIVAHANGGMSTYENFAMVLKEHNRAMGSMNLEDYKKSLLQAA